MIKYLKLFVISTIAATVLPAWGDSPDRDIQALVARNTLKSRSPAYLPTSVREIAEEAVPVARAGLSQTLAELNAENL